MALVLDDTPLFYLKKKFIHHLKGLVDFYRREFCGNLNNDNNILTPIAPEYKGPEIQMGQRGVCEWRVHKTREYYHTHPTVSKSYPSYGDIFSIAGKSYQERRISIIGTFWGIWYIYKEDYQENLSDNKEDEKRLKNDVYEEISKDIYNSTYSYDLSVSSSRPYDENVKESLSFPINLFNAEFEKYCNLGFISWDNIYSLLSKNDTIPFYRFLTKCDEGFFFRRKAVRKSQKAVRKSLRKSQKASRRSLRKSRKTSRRSLRKSRKAVRKSLRKSRKTVRKYLRKSRKTVRKSLRKSRKTGRKSLRKSRKTVRKSLQK